MERGEPYAALPPLRYRSERLVGLGFRCWLSGYETGDLSCWQTVWSEYADAIGAKQARQVVTDLSTWVREVRSGSSRPINVAAIGCPTFCRDECMAISMIAACQRDVCPAARACAFALLGHDRIEPAIGAAIDFAGALRACGEILTEGAICNAVCAVPAASARRH